MNSQIEGIGNLEKPVGTLKILVHLHKNEKATITNLIMDVKLNQKTTYSALENLREKDLIYQEESKGFPLCKYYKLTDKGSQVAKHLGEIACLLIHDYQYTR